VPGSSSRSERIGDIVFTIKGKARQFYPSCKAIETETTYYCGDIFCCDIALLTAQSNLLSCAVCFSHCATVRIVSINHSNAISRQNS